MLSGYKTYIAAFAAITFGAYQIYMGNVDAGVQSIIGGFGLFGLRNAITPKTNTPEVKE